MFLSSQDYAWMFVFFHRVTLDLKVKEASKASEAVLVTMADPVFQVLMEGQQRKVKRVSKNIPLS